MYGCILSACLSSTWDFYPPGLPELRLPKRYNIVINLLLNIYMCVLYIYVYVLYIYITYIYAFMNAKVNIYTYVLINCRQANE